MTRKERNGVNKAICGIIERNDFIFGELTSMFEEITTFMENVMPESSTEHPSDCDEYEKLMDAIAKIYEYRNAFPDMAKVIFSANNTYLED